MLYEKYQSKMLKVSAMRQWVKARRALLISIAAVLFAFMITSFSVKGVVYRTKDIPSQITYGESIEYSAKAFFADVWYEYAAEGSTEWSETPPTRAGNYKVRAVSTRIFGAAYYGKEQKYQILPKEIDVSIAQESLQYGETPLVFAELMYEDTISCDGFEYADLSGTSTQARAVRDNIVIRDSEGVDVTDSYTINTLTNELGFTTRFITVTTAGAEKVYDGTPLSCEGIEVTGGKLAKGDEIEAVFPQFRTDAGETENKAEILIFTSGGVDVTHHYVIDQIAGRLSVQKRTLQIVTEGAAKIYDGTPLTQTNYQVLAETTLVEGHTLLRTKETALENVGSVSNVLVFSVMSGDSEVTQNYDLVFTNGVLTVSPRSVKLRTESDQKTYDGLPLEKKSYSVVLGGFLSRHRAEEIAWGSITQAGSVANTLKVEVFEGESNVSQNYALEYETGTLTVMPCQISIRTATLSMPYNAKPQTYQDIEILYGLVAGDRVEVVAESLTYLTDVGTATNLLSVKIYNSQGADVSQSYTIVYTYGSLTVTKLDLDVTTNTKDFIYNGQWQFEDGLHTTPLVPEGLTVFVVPETLTKIRDVEPIAGGFYREYDNQFQIKIFEGSRDVSFNFDLSYIYGKVKMLPRPITVTTGTSEFVYDGILYSDFSFATSDDLVGGHTAQYKAGTGGYWSEVGRELDGSLTANQNAFTVEFFAEGQDVSHFYAVTYIYGTVTILPRPITLTSYTATWDYDGQVHFNEGFTIESGSLVLGQSIIVTFRTEITDVVRIDSDTYGSVENVLDFEIFAGADSKTHNYEISCNWGTLTIIPLPIAVTSHSNTWDYDGTWHWEKGYTSVGSLVAGHSITVLGWTEIREVGIKSNELAVGIFEGTTDKSHNYKITYYLEGVLEVRHRQVTITTATAQWVYDGQTHFDTSHTITAGSLAAGQVSEAIESSVTKVANVIRDAGGNVTSTSNGFLVLILHNGENVTANYQITYIYGTLKINPRQIAVKLTDKVKEYDGTPLTSVEFEILPASPFDIVEGQFGVASAVGSQTEIGESGNAMTGFSIFEGGKDVSNNYQITMGDGLLVVVKRIAVVFAHDANKIFDGDPLTCAEYHSLNLLDGHILTAVTSGSQTVVGASDNIIEPLSVTITKDGVDVSHLYNIVLEKGILFVHMGEVTLTTGSAEKVYDGNPLTNPEYEVTGLPDGFTVTVTVTGTITDIGTAYNSATITIWDSEGKISNDFWIDAIFGTLTVTDGKGGGEGEAGNIDLDGDINRLPNVGEGGDAVTFRATSDTSGTVYFRIKSFGDYNENGWDNASPYTTSTINPLYLTYLALAKSGKTPSLVSIEPVAKGLSYMLPYYAQNGYYTLDDTIIDVAYDPIYSTNYLPYTYKSGDSFSVGGTGQESFEQAYYQYVLDNYLQLPATTRTEMLEVAAKNNLKADSPTLIEDLTAFVQNKVKYDLNFNEYVGDIAVYFFKEAKTGICQHYATAATALLRALGVPARYVVGFVGNMSAGKTVDVTPNQAHAWVEIYIAGMGWVQIEVTGAGEGSNIGGGGGSGDGGGNGGEESQKSLSIKPIDVFKPYDGTPLYPENIVEGTTLDSILLLQKLIDQEYYYKVTVSGSRTDYGVSDSLIEDFVLYDKYGKNVTEEFDLAYETGRIKITGTPIYIHLYELSKYYDGKPLSYASDDYYVDALPEGYNLEFNLSGTLTDIGRINMSELEALPFKVYDSQGNDVTQNFSLIFLGTPLTVYKRSIEITSQSETKIYDGKPLSSNITWISKGMLPAGHSYEATITVSITDIGSMKNVIEQIIIFDSQGKDVTQNFDIKFINGVLKIV